MREAVKNLITQGGTGKKGRNGGFENHSCFSPDEHIIEVRVSGYYLGYRILATPGHTEPPVLSFRGSGVQPNPEGAGRSVVWR
jgi:hypothetical protein